MNSKQFQKLYKPWQKATYKLTNKNEVWTNYGVKVQFIGSEELFKFSATGSTKESAEANVRAFAKKIENDLGVVVIPIADPVTVTGEAAVFDAVLWATIAASTGEDTPTPTPPKLIGLPESEREYVVYVINYNKRHDGAIGVLPVEGEAELERYRKVIAEADGSGGYQLILLCANDDTVKTVKRYAAKAYALALLPSVEEPPAPQEPEAPALAETTASEVKAPETA